ncbi:hypothetical protein [Vibrio parahaemolyticus]|uniref:hypothetical protein n=1 Tax=Vibrio parahaemolyticus TaxID=670 RepID=UPI000AA4EE30|nr:hypothetical protein [Vibrio parahaemolyticus]
MTRLAAVMPAFATDILSNKERAIVPIAGFSASGDVEKRKISLSDCLEIGLTIDEFKEVLA